jgi:hypothetical protein
MQVTCILRAINTTVMTMTNATEAHMIYGVFFIKNGKWELAQTYSTKFNAQQEVDYLTKSLGLTARIFIKK